MTRPTTVLVLLTLTLVATVNTFTPLNDAPARSLVDEVFKKHGVNPAQVGVSARDSDSAPAKAKDSAPTPASAPAKAKDSAPTPAPLKMTHFLSVWSRENVRGPSAGSQ